MELVGKLELTSPNRQRPAGPDRRRRGPQGLRVPILNSWDSPDAASGGGTFVVDIRNPAQPGSRSRSSRAQEPFYHGEGAHAISVNTPQFTGDMLAVNNETYGSNVTRRPTAT